MRIPTDAIDDTALIRDRTHLDPAAMAELQASIAASGLRLPIEVTPTATGYALISGYRRLYAVRALHALTGDAAQWDTLHPILAESRAPTAAAHRPTTPHRPRRLSRPRADLSIRRERTRTGYVLHVTGKGASDALVAEVLDEIERMFGPA